MINTDIPIYRLMVLLSLLSNIIVVFKIYKKDIFTKDEIIGAIVYENIGIIIGAKLLTYLQNITKYGHFDLINIGYSSYGAIIGAITFLIIFAIQFRKKFKDMLLTFIPSIPLMYSIGKIGCFFSGCCYGLEYDGFPSIIYKYSISAPNNIPLVPIQLLETIAFFIIFLYIIYTVSQNKYGPSKLGISFILCGLTKFLLDFLRATHATKIITLNQTLSICFIIIGIIIYYFTTKKHAKA